MTPTEPAWFPGIEISSTSMNGRHHRAKSFLRTACVFEIPVHAHEAT